jgi:hypothetical protein
MPDLSPITEPLYFSGQGELYIGPKGCFDKADGDDPADGLWVGDLEAFSVTPAETAEETKETWSGQRSVAIRNVTERSIAVSFAFRRFMPRNLAKAISGLEVNDPAGVVANEDIGNPTVDSVVKLAHEGVSGVIITDSAANTLPASQYVVAEDHGALRILDKTTGGPYTAPFLVDYTYSERVRVPFFKIPAGTRHEVLFLGLNTAAVHDPAPGGNERPMPHVLRLYDVELAAGTELAMIGEAVQGFTITGSARLDTTKLVDAALGQFGYLSLVPPEEYPALGT